MKLYDATLPIHEKMVVFPGDPPFKKEPVSQIQTGDHCNLARITMGTHLGTHVDPPAHFFANGATVEQIALETLVGPGAVVDLRGCSQIDRHALENASVAGYTRVLMKTDNGPRLLDSAFHQDYVHLTEDGARYLVNPGSPVHHLLLEAGILVAEGVHLLDIPPGEYEIFCLPLKIKGADGAPARILLRG